jgi:hypothetical protein
MKKIYIAHPFTNYGDPETNLSKQVGICQEVFGLGHIPVSPILTFGKCIPHDKGNYQTAMNACYWLLSACDEVWFFGEWEKSKGCVLEYEFALKLGFARISDNILSRGDSRIITCQECSGSGCKECYDGVIRVTKRSESRSIHTLLEIREREVGKLRRKFFPESALIPCEMCGKLMQYHNKIGDSHLCPLDDQTGI